LGVDQRGERITDTTFYLLLNSSPDDVVFFLPNSTWGGAWRVVLDTMTGEPPDLVADPPASALLPAPEGGEDVSDASSVDPDKLFEASSDITVTSRSVVLLERVS
ncbi:MAG TPA: hypothetical protein VMZ66_06990, partial [Aeromicrobium sp.]|nr:hypothetical protein [Aeromicrobium sp.]